MTTASDKRVIIGVTETIRELTDCLDEPEKNCHLCEYIRINHAGFGPRHNGSPFCESGSIASGGERSHCTCDLCF